MLELTDSIFIMENRSDVFFERRNKLLPQGIPSPIIVASKAKGSKIFDLNGKEYIDFISGIGVMAVGHAHEVINRAVKEQIDKFSHTCFGLIGYTPYLNLAEKLCRLFPHGTGSEDTKVFLTNSGSDSVENAVKIARSYTRRGGIIAFTHAFHGRHYMSMSLTDKPKNRKYCGPLPGEIYRLRFPSYFHYNKGERLQNYLEQEIQALKDFFNHGVNPEEIAAVIFEPVQGEGGFSVMPLEYLSTLTDICRQQGILIIADEVQSGFGRTAKWAAYQYFKSKSGHNFRPDLSVWAKALGAGYPIGAVLGRKEIMDGIPPGILGGTYLGNPVACAAGNAALTYMEEVNFPILAQERGEVIKKKFQKLYEEYDNIGEVRGLGAMLAIEFCKQRNPYEPDGDFCKQLITRCREAGLLLIPAGASGNVVRILCPLNIELNLLADGLNIFEKEIKRLITEKKV